MFSEIRIARALTVAVTLVLLGFTSPAGAANWFEKNIWMSGPKHHGDLPACDSGWALWEIKRNFSTKEGRFWNSDLSITDFERVQETAYSPWAPQAIPRRFCSAVAVVSDGVRRPVHYSIAEDLGLIGASWGSNGAWSASTATGPTILAAASPGPSSFLDLDFVLEMFSLVG